jgi:hypothetical protein
MTLSLACNQKQTDSARVSETKSIEESARPLQVAIFASLSTGDQSGIDCIMDEWRDARQVDRFANVKGHFITTRVSGSRLLSPVVLAHAISRFLLVRLLGRARVVHINLSAVGCTYRKLILGRISRMCRSSYVLHLHSSGLDYFWDVAFASDRLIADPELRRRPGENGRALPRTRLDIELCAERSVATWTESIHAGER